MILTIFPTVKSSVALLNLYYEVVTQTSLSRFPSVLPSNTEFTASPMTSNNALYLSRCSTVQNNVDYIEALSYSVSNQQLYLQWIPTAPLCCNAYSYLRATE